jgi:hypothetical protein
MEKVIIINVEISTGVRGVTENPNFLETNYKNLQA